MPRVIITTCGTSLLTSNCWEIEIQAPDRTMKKMSEEQAILDPTLQKPENLEKRIRLEQTYSENINLYGNNPDKLAENFDMQVWDDPSKILKLPAELASLRAIINFFKCRQQELNKQDNIVLIHSDNDDGKFCAKVLKGSLEKKIKIGCGIQLSEVEGLDPKDATGFNKAIMRIWDECQKEITEKQNNEYIFNLTGGYKGTAIILGGLAYKLHEKARMAIFYLHETSDYENISVYHFRNKALYSGYITQGGETFGSLDW